MGSPHTGRGAKYQNQIQHPRNATEDDTRVQTLQCRPRLQDNISGLQGRFKLVGPLREERSLAQQPLPW